MSETQDEATTEDISTEFDTSPEIHDYEPTPEERQDFDTTSEKAEQFEYRSLDEVLQVLEDGREWERTATSSGGEYLKFETQESFYRDQEGKENRVLNRDQHGEILDDLFTQGYSVKERSEGEKLIREVYFAAENGELSYSIDVFSPLEEPQNQDSGEELLGLIDSDSEIEAVEGTIFTEAQPEIKMEQPVILEAHAQVERVVEQISDANDESELIFKESGIKLVSVAKETIVKEVAVEKATIAPVLEIKPDIVLESEPSPITLVDVISEDPKQEIELPEAVTRQVELSEPVVLNIPAPQTIVKSVIVEISPIILEKNIVIEKHDESQVDASAVESVSIEAIEIQKENIVAPIVERDDISVEITRPMTKVEVVSNEIEITEPAVAISSVREATTEGQEKESVVLNGEITQTLIEPRLSSEPVIAESEIKISDDVEQSESNVITRDQISTEVIERVVVEKNITETKAAERTDKLEIRVVETNSRPERVDNRTETPRVQIFREQTPQGEIVRVNFEETRTFSEERVVLFRAEQDSQERSRVVVNQVESPLSANTNELNFRNYRPAATDVDESELGELRPERQALEAIAA